MKDLISNQLVKYLEARGVEHVFGLCGHTNIAVLAALAKSRIKFVNTRHEQIAAHAAPTATRGQRTRLRSCCRISGPGLTNAGDGRRQRRARLGAHGRDRRRRADAITTASIRTRK